MKIQVKLELLHIAQPGRARQVIP